MTDVLDGYRPQGMCTDDWEQLRPVVAELLAPLDGETAMRARTAVVKLARFALDAGHVPTVALLLREELQAQWVATLPSTRTASTHRSRLRRLARAHDPARAATHQPLARATTTPAPYPHGQVERMLAHADALPSELQRVTASSVVLTGAGAGLDGKDLAGMTGAQVRRCDARVLVDVAGSRRARTVAVLDRYADRLADVAARSEALAPGRLLAGPGATPGGAGTDGATRLFDGWGEDRVTARRLRITWLATLVQAGTPLPVLMDQAGVSSLRAVDDIADHLATTMSAADIHARAAGALP